MELYLVYEFTYSNPDEYIDERVDFIKLCKTEDEAKEIANEQVKLGIKNNDVVVDPKIEPFSERYSVSMYRANDEDVDVYSIKIKRRKKCKVLLVIKIEAILVIQIIVVIAVVTS